MNRSISMICALIALVSVQSVNASVADSHVARGQACTVCHAGDKPVADNVSIDACIACHTESPKGKPAEIDGHKIANVHQAHFDTYDCFQCHKGHKSSTFVCNQCHKTVLPTP